MLHVYDYGNAMRNIDAGDLLRFANEHPGICKYSLILNAFIKFDDVVAFIGQINS